MKEQENGRVRITGAADPRGTEEYNLALGDRRATSVKRFLSALGVADTAIETVSTGEEFATGTDESTWARDRRAEISTPTE